MKKNQIWLVLLSIAVVVMGIVQVASSAKEDIYYVQTKELFDNFKMTKDLKKQLDNVGIQRKNFLDSLKLEIEIIDRQIKAGDNSRLNEYETKVEDYMKLLKDLQSNQQEVAQNFDQRVFDKLNELIKSYGEENHIDFIIGVNGEGTILYANEGKDITQEMLSYINQKYKN